jgi:6-phosphofructokinase 1
MTKAGTRMKKVRRIGVLTAGGDCPGLNAVIRGVTKSAILDYGVEVVGVEDGFQGLIEDRVRLLSYTDVSNILTLGGTILGTSNTSNPFRCAVKARGKTEYRDVSGVVRANARKHRLDGLVAIGGDGTMAIAHRLSKQGLRIVGVPKTIDNDLPETDVTFGFDTAVHTATDALDKVHTTAMSHHRVMIVEVMGRYAGWIALHAGVASGADVILIPEIPYRLGSVSRTVVNRSRKGKRFSIIVVAEGARPEGGDMVVARRVAESTDPVRLGGVGNMIARQLTEACGLECRVTVLGHVQRGGTPTPFDRVLATRFGTHAMKLVMAGKFGRMVTFKDWKISDTTLARATAGLRLVDPRGPVVGAARSVGTCFGD